MFPPIHKVYEDYTVINASDPKYGNWMLTFSAPETNTNRISRCCSTVAAYTLRVCGVIVAEELLVWYDDLQYDIYMGIPVGFKGKSGTSSSLCKSHTQHLLRSTAVV